MIYFMIIFCFLTGILWIALFPAISISTGEMKTRGLYVDENSLLVRYGNPNQGITEVKYVKLEVEKSICSIVIDRGLKCRNWNESTIEMTEFIIDSPYHSKSMESLLLVFHFNQDYKMSNILENIISNLLSNLMDVKWLSKRIIVLLMTDKEPMNQKSKTVFNNWLKQKSKCNKDILIPRNYGLIRESLIIDLTRFSNSTILTDNYQTLKWNQGILKVVGFNGLLPNMDMISSILATGINKNIFITEGNNKICSKLQNYFNSFVSQIIYENILDFSSVIPDGYKLRFCGLLSFLWELIKGSSGLHGVLSLSNIDAVTMELIPLENNLKGKIKHRFYTEKDLIQFIFQNIFVLNNLHEELHHSFFYYLLMGNNHFVGISEYGFPALILILSIFLIFFKLYNLIQPVLKEKPIFFLKTIVLISMHQLPIIIFLFLIYSFDYSDTMNKVFLSELKNNNYGLKDEIYSGLIGSLYVIIMVFTIITSRNSSNKYEVITVEFEEKEYKNNEKTNNRKSEWINLLKYFKPNNHEMHNDDKPNQDKETTEIQCSISLKHENLRFYFLLCVFEFLVLFAWVLAQNFAFGIFITIPTIFPLFYLLILCDNSKNVKTLVKNPDFDNPKEIVRIEEKKISKRAIFILSFICMLYNPVTMLVLLKSLFELDVLNLILAWQEFGSLTFPVLVIFSSITGFLASHFLFDLLNF